MKEEESEREGKGRENIEKAIIEVKTEREETKIEADRAERQTIKMRSEQLSN